MASRTSSTAHPTRKPVTADNSRSVAKLNETASRLRENPSNTSNLKPSNAVNRQTTSLSSRTSVSIVGEETSSYQALQATPFSVYPASLTTKHKGSTAASHKASTTRRLSIEPLHTGRTKAVSFPTTSSKEDGNRHSFTKTMQHAKSTSTAVTSTAAVTITGKRTLKSTKGLDATDNLNITTNMVSNAKIAKTEITSPNEYKTAESKVGKGDNSEQRTNTLKSDLKLPCRESKIFPDVQFPSGHQKLLGNVPDMLTCIALSCDVGGDVAYMRGSQCFVIQCASPVNCEPRTVKNVSSGTFVAFLRKTHEGNYIYNFL